VDLREARPMNRIVARARDAGAAARSPICANPAAPAAQTAGRWRSAVRSLEGARLALAAVLGLRLALSPFVAAVGQPDALWRPRGTGRIFPSPPPAALVVALQVVGVAAAVAYLVLVLRRRRSAGDRREAVLPLAVAWACLLVLAGLRTSLGKILHNDVLLLLAAGPLLLAGTDPDEEGARTGLDAAAAIVVLGYLSAFWWKLLRTGPAWALSDNLRWALAEGRGGARWPALSEWLVAHPAACVALACSIVALEAGAVLLWLRPALAPWFVAAATAMHAGTWLVLGLDYWAHLAAVALVLLPWARMRRR
jgi:hypothetical protein